MSVSTGAPHPEDAVFARFNRHQGMGRVRDPHPEWAALRRRAPVQRARVSTLFGGGAAGLLDREKEAVAVFGFDAAAEVLRDAERFSSAAYEQTLGRVLGPSLLALDGRAHTALRRVLQPALGRRALGGIERELVAPAVAGRVGRLAGWRRADLIPSLTFPFPVEVIARMIGLAPREHARFHRLAVALISVAFDPARGLRASRDLGSLFAAHLAARRREPADDLTGLLAAARVEGEPLEDATILACLRLLAPAGAETTYRSTSNLLFALLSHPAQLEAVRADRRLVAPAIEEALRWEPPLTSILRTATRETELGGLCLAPGTPVAVCLAAANRDPARWSEPDRFDVTRPPRPHAAFAFGPHACPGMHLARMEMRVALEALLDRFPTLRLDPEARDPHVTGLTFRTPLALPVRLDDEAPSP